MKRELVSHPALLDKGADWELWHLPTHRNHSYDVHRYKLNTSVEVATQGKCHVLNLVEGESAEVETAGGSRFRLSCRNAGNFGGGRLLPHRQHLGARDHGREGFYEITGIFPGCGPEQEPARRYYSYIHAIRTLT